MIDARSASLNGSTKFVVATHPPLRHPPKRLFEPRLAPRGLQSPCLATARARFGTCIINTIHYQSAVSLPLEGRHSRKHNHLATKFLAF